MTVFPLKIKSLVLSSSLIVSTSNFAKSGEEVADFVRFDSSGSSNMVLPGGCTDPLAVNFDPDAIEDDGTCVYDTPLLSLTAIGGNQVCRGQEIAFVITGLGSLLPVSSLMVEFSDGSAPLIFTPGNFPELNTFTHTFNQLSCGFDSPDGIPNAFAVSITALDINSNGYVSASVDPLFVSGAADFAQTGVFQSPGTGPFCVNQPITFVNYGFGFFEASETGCLQNYAVEFEADGADFLELNTAIFPQYAEVSFSQSGEYSVHTSINGICPVETTVNTLTIGPPVGSVSVWVSEPNDFSPISGMAVDLYNYGLQPQVFGSLSGLTDATGKLEFIGVPGGVYMSRATPDLTNPLQAGYISTFTNEVANWGAAHLIAITCNTHFKDTIFMIPQALPHPIGGQASGRLVYRDEPPGMGPEGGWTSNMGFAVAGDPIPGIPIIISKDTASLSTGQPIITPISMRLTSDSPNISERGFYDFSGLGPGDYRVHVDMPGLPMAETYFFTIGVDELVFEFLDFFADTTDAIYINDYEEILVNEFRASSLKAFPNPFSDIITIELPEDINRNQLQWQLINVLGVRVRPVLVHVNDRQMRINGSNLPNGYYIMHISDNQRLFSIPIIKQ